MTHFLTAGVCTVILICRAGPRVRGSFLTAKLHNRIPPTVLWKKIDCEHRATFIIRDRMSAADTGSYFAADSMVALVRAAMAGGSARND